jgi:hypothetical protein
VSSDCWSANAAPVARLADNPVQQAAGGRLEAIELHFVGTDDSLTALGPTTFTFEGPEAEESIRVPMGDHSGLFLVVDTFEVRFEEDGALTTVIASDFDLLLPATFATRRGRAYELRFGDEDWLARIADLTEPGEIRLDGTDAELESAFFDGLIEGSTVLDAGP